MTAATLCYAVPSLAEGSAEISKTSEISYAVEVPCPPDASATRLSPAKFVARRHPAFHRKGTANHRHRPLHARSKAAVRPHAPTVRAKVSAGVRHGVAASHRKHKSRPRHHRPHKNTLVKRVGRCEVVHRDRLAGGLQTVSTAQTLAPLTPDPTGGLVTQPSITAQGQGPLNIPLRDYPIGLGSGSGLAPVAADGVAPVSAAPEPGEWVLILLGVSLVGSAFRRRRGSATTARP